MGLHEQTPKMEGEPTAKNVQKGARFKIQRENEARMLVTLAPPERGKMRGSQWGGGFYGYRLKFGLFYGYRLIFFSYG